MNSSKLLGCVATLGISGAVIAAVPDGQTLTYDPVVRFLIGLQPGKATGQTIGSGTIIGNGIKLVKGVRHGFVCVLTCAHNFTTDGKRTSPLDTGIGIGFGNSPGVNALSTGYLADPTSFAIGTPNKLVDLGVMAVDIGPITSDDWKKISKITPVNVVACKSFAQDPKSLVGSTFSAMGYGNTGTKWLDPSENNLWDGWQNTPKSGGTLRFANSTVTRRTAPSEDSFGYTSETLRWVLKKPGGANSIPGEGAILPGDSGGPMLFSNTVDVGGIKVNQQSLSGVITGGIIGQIQLFGLNDTGTAITQDYANWINNSCAACPEPHPLVVITLGCGLLALRRRKRN